MHNNVESQVGVGGGEDACVELEISQHSNGKPSQEQHGDIENKKPIFVNKIAVNENNALGNFKIQEKTKVQILGCKGGKQKQKIHVSANQFTLI